jgi:hypothetical protein
MATVKPSKDIVTQDGSITPADVLRWFKEPFPIEAIQEDPDEVARRIRSRMYEAESDYCEDLAEIYIQNGTNEDVVRYKAIHLMDKGANYNNADENGEKF